MKLYFRVFRESLWDFESKERLGKICKLVQYTIFCLVHFSWHMTSTCYHANQWNHSWKNWPLKQGFTLFTSFLLVLCFINYISLLTSLLNGSHVFKLSMNYIKSEDSRYNSLCSAKGLLLGYFTLSVKGLGSPKSRLTSRNVTGPNISQGINGQRLYFCMEM